MLNDSKFPTVLSSIFNSLNIQSGVDVANRSIFLNPDINVFSVGEFISKILLIFNSSEDITSPITIYISSYGGDISAAYAIIDYFKSLNVKFNTVGVGPIMSAAALILISGTGERSVTSQSSIMVHPVSGNFTGCSSDMGSDAVQIKLLQSRINTLLENHSNQSNTFWKKKTANNFYMNPEQALSYGLIDRIIEPISK